MRTFLTHPWATVGRLLDRRAGGQAPARQPAVAPDSRPTPATAACPTELPVDAPSPPVDVRDAPDLPDASDLPDAPNLSDAPDLPDLVDEVDDLLDAVASAAFGFDALRPGQREAMRALLERRDTLCVLPTGAGKSAVYQIPALLLEGPTVVVSPLIALQRDQVRGLTARLDQAQTQPQAQTPPSAPDRASAPEGPPSPEADAAERTAVMANSQVSTKAVAEAFSAIRHGRSEFLFLAPEQLTKPHIRELLREAAPSLIVIDEAHCISSWGHDFRPDYLRLGEVIEDLGHPTVVALTATAAPPVRREIVERLRLREPVEIVQGFDRPNIHLSVRTFVEDADKRAALVEYAATQPKPGIVYAATRRATEEIAAELADLGLAARPYHAGLAAGLRRETENAFLSGQCDVIVATTAFGMGIDKPDVRFVAHADVPDSLDSYMQEIGRAGRDGDPALACLFFRPQDLGLRRFFVPGPPDPADLRRVAVLVAHAGEPVTLPRLAKEAGLRDSALIRLVDPLAEAGALTLHGDGTVEAPADAPEPDVAVAKAVERAEVRRTFDRSRVDMVRGYAETRGCRRRFLLSYFGEAVDRFEPAGCGACDTCDSRDEPAAGRDGDRAAAATPEGVAEQSAPAAPFEAGSRVQHERWGAGQVVSVDGDRFTVLFDDAGYRTLAVEAVLERGLVVPLPAASPP